MMRNTVFCISIFCAALWSTHEVHAAPCHTTLSGEAVAANFGAPYSFLISTLPLIVTADCTPGSVTITAGSGAQFDYVYRLGYEWVGTGWQPFDFTGASQTGEWFVGQAEANRITTPNTPTFMVAFICQWNGSEWKCGCQDQACTTPAWQLQTIVNTQAGGGSSSTSGSTSGGFQTGTKNIPAGYVKDDRDRFWENKGYELFWVGTPIDSDVGRNPKDYFENTWNGEYPLRSYEEDPSSGRVSIARAPDGTPALKGEINDGDKDLIIRVFGNQFGPIGPEVQIVSAMDWYNPCSGGQKANGKSGTYIGMGHVWGSADNVTDIPHSSVNFDNAWSFRLTLGSSNRFAPYVYIPNKPNAYGIGLFTDKYAQDYPCDEWLNMEMEIIQNDVGEKNGIVRTYLDGTLEDEALNFESRIYPDVRPKGHGVFVKHNSGPNDPETTYMKSWKLYIK